MLDFRQRLMATTLLVGAAALATPAFAQGASSATPQTASAIAKPNKDKAARAEKAIVITGSRIPQPNLTSAAPVTVVTSEDLKLSGTTRVEDMLNSLPSVGASMTSSMSNGATGTAEVDLRYLGSKRTLTLVDGRRLMPGDPVGTSQAADLNVIPSALVKRVDVLTGGASSVYGADAVAGVVNFIMDTSFTGVRFDSQYSFYQHNNDDPGVGNGQHISDLLNARAFAYPRGSVADGGTFDGTLTIGAGFDDNRGHAVAYLGYRNVNSVLQGRRDYSACVVQNKANGGPTCGGSAVANPGNAIMFADNGTSSTIAALGPGKISIGSENLYNFAPLNYLQRPDERYIGGAFADYEVSPALHPYSEFMFMDDHTFAQIAPSGDFGQTLAINCDNPLMSKQQHDTICNPTNLINGFVGNFPVAVGASYNPAPGAAPIDFIDPVSGKTYHEAFFQLLRRNVEGGPRIGDLKHTSYRGVVGTRGELGNVWSYDAYFQYGRTDYSQVYRNEFSATRLARALDVVTDSRVGSATYGQPVCRSVLTGTDPNCVPYDVFGSGPSRAAINYLNVFGIMEGQTSEQVADANVTGELGQMGVQTPWADEGVGVNFGTEYRKESLDLNPDQEFQTGDLTGQGGATLPVSGSFRVLEAFAETHIPLVRHSFLEDFSIDAGYRKSWYKLQTGRTYSTSTYKIAAELAPVRDIRFRGAYNRAVRAPNIQELFAPSVVALDGSNDPCAKTITASDHGCLAQGLKVGQSPTPNPAGQYNGMLGGNPDLKPEIATTKTIGVVLQPRWIPNLALTLDYWDINLKGAIQGFGADAILANCMAHTTATSIAPSCSLVHRDASGSIWLTPNGYVDDLPNNSADIRTDGLDINGSYSHRIGALGSLSASFIGTYLRKYEVNNGLEGGTYDCAGLYGPTCSGGSVASSAPMPRWRHKARLSWNMPSGIGLSLQWRYVGKVEAETLADNETLHGANNFAPGLRIGAQNYFDFASTFTVGSHYRLRLGVDNLFDRDPPLVTSGNSNKSGSDLCPVGPCNGNTYPGTWDAFGRYIYAGATLTF